MNRVASAEGAKARAKTAMVERNIVYARLKGHGVGVGLLGDFWVLVGVRNVGLKSREDRER